MIVMPSSLRPWFGSAGSPTEAVDLVAGQPVGRSERSNTLAKGGFFALQPLGFALPKSKLNQKAPDER
jgi:hypothetical protein